MLTSPSWAEVNELFVRLLSRPCAEHDSTVESAVTAHRRAGELFQRSPAEDSPLMLAIATGQMKTIEHLIGRSADVNATGNYDETVLARTLIVGYNDQDGFDPVVGLLLGHGADANRQYAFGVPPLYLSIKVKCLTATKLLIVAGANVNGNFSIVVQDSEREISGFRPLHAAAESGRKFVEILLDHGASIDVRTINGLTPLHCALSSTAELRISHGADIFAIDREGQTPLHKAALRTPANSELIAVYMRHGAPVNIVDLEGNTPFHCLAEQRHKAPENKEMDGEWHKAALSMFAAKGDVLLQTKHRGNVLSICRFVGANAFMANDSGFDQEARMHLNI